MNIPINERLEIAFWDLVIPVISEVNHTYRFSAKRAALKWLPIIAFYAVAGLLIGLGLGVTGNLLW